MRGPDWRPDWGPDWGRTRLAFLGDRIIVLFMGAFVGAAIALAFVGGGQIRPGVPPAAATPAVSAAAPPALECATPFAPRLLGRLARARTITVGVFGDSFGDGVGAALRALLANENVMVLDESRVGSGFTRYQSLDLERDAVARLNVQPVDIAVIVIGANDIQGTFDDAGRHAYDLLTPGWKAVYGARVDRFVKRLRDQGALVYWIGLPTMRQPAYDRDIAALDTFLAARMALLGVPFIPTRPLTVDAEGRFNLYLSDGGGVSPVRMRANDGIHMTFAGYERLARPVADRIRAYLIRAADQARAEGAAPGAGDSWAARS